MHKISQNEFYGCTNLKNVSIGDGVTTIGKWAFSGCTNLDYFAFGASVESIGQEAFSDCTAVTQIISKASTPPVCEIQALDDINKWTCSLNVPNGKASLYQAAEQWKEFFFVQEEKPVVNNYKLTYVVDGEEYKSYEIEEGDDITPEAEPTKDGYTFSGWSGIPTTMPANDVTVTGTFTRNEDIDGKIGITTGKHIMKKTEVEGSTTYVYEYEYDENGRVKKLTESRSGQSSGSATTTFTYGNSTITTRTDGDWNNTIEHLLTFRDGRIVKDVQSKNGTKQRTDEFVYDANGYLKTQTSNNEAADGSTVIEYTWNDGNLTKYVKSSDGWAPDTYQYSYTDKAWAGNWHMYWDGTNVLDALQPICAYC